MIEHEGNCFYFKFTDFCLETILKILIDKIEDFYPNLNNSLMYCAPEVVFYKIYEITGINVIDLIHMDHATITCYTDDVENCDFCKNNMQNTCGDDSCTCFVNLQKREIIHALLVELRKNVLL